MTDGANLDLSQLLSDGTLARLDRAQKLKILASCGVKPALVIGGCTIIVGKTTVAAESMEDAINGALAVLKTRPDLWPAVEHRP